MAYTSMTLAVSGQENTRELSWRSPNGKVLGIFNAEYFLEGNAQGLAAPKIANFALANDTLVILAQTQSLDNQSWGRFWLILVGINL